MRFRLPVGLSDGPPRSLCWRSAASTMMTAVARTAQIKRMISRRRVDQPSRLGEAPRIALSSASACSSDRAESIDRREAASKGVRSEGCHANTQKCGQCLELFQMNNGRAVLLWTRLECCTYHGFLRSCPPLGGSTRSQSSTHERSDVGRCRRRGEVSSVVLLELICIVSLEIAGGNAGSGVEWGPVSATQLL